MTRRSRSCALRSISTASSPFSGGSVQDKRPGRLPLQRTGARPRADEGRATATILRRGRRAAGEGARTTRSGIPAYQPRLRVAIVTARNAPAHTRVITTLREWGIQVDEAFFLGGVEKAEILRTFQPHIFFDDQLRHIERGRRRSPRRCTCRSGWRTLSRRRWRLRPCPRSRRGAAAQARTRLTASWVRHPTWSPDSNCRGDLAPAGEAQDRGRRRDPAPPPSSHRTSPHNSL